MSSHSWKILSLHHKILPLLFYGYNEQIAADIAVRYLGNI